MNEKVLKKRAWIKNAIIIFLAVMLLLTFFSNTILNYSLPEVAAQYPASGTVTSKIRASGTVEANENYEVVLSESRTIKSVSVKNGDTVKKGDVLFLLEDAESSELKEAQASLEDLQSQLKKAQLTATPDYSAQEIEIANAEEDLQKARQNKAAIPEKQQALTDAKLAVKKAQRKVDELNKKIEALRTPDENGNLPPDAEKKLGALTAELSDAQDTLDAATEAQASAEAAAGLTEEQADEAIKTLERQVESLRNALRVQKKEDSRNQAISDIDLEALKRNVDKQQETVNKLKSKAVDAKVTAKMDGTVRSISCTSGETVEAGTPLAQIQLSGKGYSATFPLTPEQAKRVNPGDEASIQYYWDSDVKAKVESVKNDPDNPGKSKLVTVAVDGNVEVGETLNFVLGERGTDYDILVPNSALHEDNNGKFVLIVTAKSTPLGNRYLATRVDVQVLASDETTTAISGALSGSDFVITTSTKPLEPGDQVRLMES